MREDRLCAGKTRGPPAFVAGDSCPRSATRVGMVLTLTFTTVDGLVALTFSGEPRQEATEAEEFRSQHRLEEASAVRGELNVECWWCATWDPARFSGAR